MRLKAKVDENHSEIVKVLRNAGCFVSDTSKLGKGFPDILVKHGSLWLPIEIKRPKERLTPNQVDWWGRSGSPPIIAYSPDDALRLMGILK